MAKRSLDVRSLEESLFKAGAYMSVAARAEDATIFVGTTKSGKSSLINFLIGNKLIGKKIRHKVCIEKVGNAYGPLIGVAATSETTIPARYTSEKLPGFALWDAPGFNDNRGDNIDICNAFFICELFKNINSAKIILVVDIATFQDDSMHAMRTLLTAIENLLTDKLKASFPGIAMILTKVDKLYDIPVTKEVITDFLQMVLNDDIDISECGKDLVRYLICNPQNIGFFKKATEGPITDDIEEGVVNAINGLHSIPNYILKEISPSISESAKVSLFKVREKLSSIDKFVELQEEVVRVLETGLQNVENIQNDELSTDDLMDLQTKLAVIKINIDKVVDETSFEKTINVLKTVDKEIEDFIHDKRLCEKAKYMEFVDKLLNLEESRNFDVCIKHTMVLASQKLKELDVQIKCRIGEINAAKANEEIAIIRKEYGAKIKKLEDEKKELSSRKCTIL